MSRKISDLGDAQAFRQAISLNSWVLFSYRLLLNLFNNLVKYAANFWAGAITRHGFIVRVRSSAIAPIAQDFPSVHARSQLRHSEISPKPN